MDSEIFKQTILLFIACLGLFWSVLLFTHKRGHKKANRFLGLLMVILSLRIMMRGSYTQPLRDYFIFLLFLSHGLAFWIGPSILFHVREMMGKSVSRSLLMKHYATGLIVALISIIGFIFRDNLMTMEITSALKAGFIIFISIQIIHLFAYIGFARKEVLHFEDSLGNYFSSTTRISLIWVKQLTLVTGLFGLIVLTMQILIVSGGYYQFNNNADFLYLLLIAGIVLTLVVKSWRRPEIYSSIGYNGDQNRDSELSVDVKKKLHKDLDLLIREEKVYTISELKLKDLADELSVQPYVLSQFLNSEYRKNFFRFINDLRIEEAEHRLRSGYLVKETIAGLAYEVGFNSKSTFNRAFKSKNGLTPTEFVKTKISST
ncbi:AraC family transcriptional regulator [Roseivirga sp. E12]|uniref:helix-turn-helix domain-containing protein n=1 Tax=Roseivirga sp. E12 TaxID=2819237 RepID=UPI001ABCA249|nr:helix-turn-helix transcriptional regulator [Roseivirga sp. E12]MBO3697208.1 helix-turn-helix transcriptional regulator [Roseivirga sp. E12]